MKTPIQHLLNKLIQFNNNKEMIIPFLLSNKTLIQDNEKDFIIRVYTDAMADSNLSEHDKNQRAKKYYLDNFEQERWK